MMPAGSQKLTAARREEIIDACAQLYEIMPFKRITLGTIGQKTSFTRTSIYNYFETKEEIFLALLEREYRAWVADLRELSIREMPKEQFPAAFSSVLERRNCMLKLMSMNLYDLESGSRIENLVSFKREYNNSMRAVTDCLQMHYPFITDEDAQQFIYAFFPFLFGIYPYTSVSEKQHRAMTIAGVEYRKHTVAQITCSLVEKLIESLKKGKG